MLEAAKAIMAMAEKDLAVGKTEVHKVEIVHHEGKLMIPKDMTLDDAIHQLIERKEFLKQKMVAMRTFVCFPYDGALALSRVMKRKFGWVPSQIIPGNWFTPDKQPEMITIDTGYGRTEQVPWGRFGIPGVNGWLQTGFAREKGRIVFQIRGEIPRADEHLVNDLFDEVSDQLKEKSIYLGQAFKVRFRDDDGEPMQLPTVEFMRTDIGPEDLILSKHLHDIIETNLFTPITRTADLLRNGIPIKRGVLLGGIYGTGKTMAAAVAAQLAVESGVTYIYVPRADELKEAIDFAKLYSDPACVVFCEDIDRVMHGERNVAMDDILNIVDGIDGKSTNIIVVLTTNFMDNINPAMLRPGRLDAVIEVTPPDAEAVTRLVKHYAGAAVDHGTDLTGVGEELAGQIPAVVAEVVKRAKLSQLKHVGLGERVYNLSAEALLESAKTMTAQLKLLEPKVEYVIPTLDEALGNVVAAALGRESKLTQKDLIKATAKGVAKFVNG
jgi:transitional endoplasmic reticulum ATPase